LVAKEGLGLASRYKRPPFFLLACDTTPSSCYYLPSLLSPFLATQTSYIRDNLICYFLSTLIKIRYKHLGALGEEVRIFIFIFLLALASLKELSEINK
jgi:hypothetical protein